MNLRKPHLVGTAVPRVRVGPYRRGRAGDSGREAARFYRIRPSSWSHGPNSKVPQRTAIEAIAHLAQCVLQLKQMGAP